MGLDRVVVVLQGVLEVNYGIVVVIAKVPQQFPGATLGATKGIEWEAIQQRVRVVPEGLPRVQMVLGGTNVVAKGFPGVIKWLW